MKSTHALLLVALAWLLLGSLYYPKWAKPWSEAAISWDVSGYYHYLPGIFIYHDLKRQDWMTYVNETYLPSPAYDQSFVHEGSGNRVNKYAIGQAVMYTPFFLVAHAYAKVTGQYPADGYSRPYQVAIWFGSLLVSILGLVLLRRILLRYFSDGTVAWTLLALGLATHWAEYAAIGNGMNHTWLFTVLCGIILCTIRFYKRKDWPSALGLGLLIGLAVLTRPTEIIWALVPLLWGMTAIGERLSWLAGQWQKVAVAVVIAAGIISIQPLYWHYVSGDWIVYSYGDQGFNWLKPKIWRGLMGVNIGWWTYTPLMLFAMFGWRGLRRRHPGVFWSTLIPSVLAVYITLSWSHFEQGGGLGQRNLIQVYPLLAFPLAAAIEGLTTLRFGRWVWIGFFLANVYYNAWWIHQAHKGGFFRAGQMTTPYFLRVAGRPHPEEDYVKLLDTREYFDGTPAHADLIHEETFDADTTSATAPMPGGSRALILDKGRQSFGPVDLPVKPGESPWIRLEADFTVTAREWDTWKFTQWIVQFHRGPDVVKTNLIRVQRLLPEDHVTQHIFFDVKVPAEGFDRCTMTFWHADSQGVLAVDNIKVSRFR